MLCVLQGAQGPDQAFFDLWRQMAYTPVLRAVRYREKSSSSRQRIPAEYSSHFVKRLAFVLTGMFMAPPAHIQGSCLRRFLLRSQ